jgi:transcriptional regulator with XRE-family HTH domain
MKTLGSRIAGIRGLKSREEFAEMYGAHRHTLAKWERDTVRPDDDILYKMSKDHDVPLDWLQFGFSPHPQHDDQKKPPTVGRGKTQHIENIDLQKKTIADAGGFPPINDELRELYRANAILLREIADLRVEVANLKHENRDLNRRLAESLTAGSEDAKPTPATASDVSGVRRAAPHSEGDDPAPTPPSGIQDSVAVP